MHREPSSTSPRAIARPAWLRYAVAIACTVLAWLVRDSMTPTVGPTALPFITFFPAIAAAAWFGGLAPGVLAALLGSLAADWFFLEPVHSLAARGQDAIALLTFLVANAFIVAAIEGMHRTRAQLVRSRDLLATTVASIGDAVILTDERGRVTFLNAEAERLCGVAPDEARGQPLERVFRIVNEATRRPAENPVERALQTGKVVGLANHTLLIARDGTETPIDDSAAPIREPGGPVSGVVLVFRDVSEQRRAQQAQARLSAIVRYSGDAIFTKNLDGIITSWNESAERLFGYTAEEAIGRPITMLIPEDRREEEPRILQRLRQGLPSERLETVRRTKEGRLLHVSLSVSPLKDAEGNVVGASKVVHDITDVVLARQALARERELLATTLASIGDAVIMTDLAGRVTFLNREAERLTGWSKAEAAGCELSAVFRIVNEETRQTVANPVEKVMQMGGVVGLANHTVLIGRDGSETPIDDSAAPIRQQGGELFGVVLVFRDITERRLAAQSLRASEERFREMADSAPVLIWVSGTDKLCTWFNKGWLDFVGRSMEQELGNGWSENVHPDDFDRCLRTYTAAFDAREPFETEYRLRRHDGAWRWVLDYGTPRQGRGGAFEGYIGSCIDITERREAEQALRHADRRKDEFLAMLSHELRNPLAPIRLAVGMLQEIGPPQRQLQELVAVIARQTTQLARLLDDLLDVGRITSGKIVLRKERIGLGQALASAIEASRPLIDSLGHHLTVTQPDQPIELDGDGARLSQVFANLLNNAAKYTDRGGRIAVEVAREGDQAIVHVRDNGIGIQAAQLPRLFEMFSQGEQPTGRGHGGLGVGLALARQLVELHGGSIEARSAGLGTGSEFTVRLPVARPRAASPPSPSRPEPLRAERPLRILVADDNADSAVLLAAMLRHTGHEVDTAFDGLEALAAALRLRPDVAILDLGMPRLSGLEVARRVRSDLGSSMVLIAMTGWGQEEDKHAASEAGFDHHLTKPVEFAVLHRLLERVEPADRPA